MTLGLPELQRMLSFLFFVVAEDQNEQPLLQRSKTMGFKKHLHLPGPTHDASDAADISYIHATSLNRAGCQGSTITYISARPCCCVTLRRRERGQLIKNKHSSVVLAYLPDRKLLPDRGGERESVEGQTSTLEVLNTLCHWERGREGRREIMRGWSGYREREIKGINFLLFFLRFICLLVLFLSIDECVGSFQNTYCLHGLLMQPTEMS